MAQSPTLFADEKEARTEAFRRLSDMRANRSIVHRVAEGRIYSLPQRLVVLDGVDKVLFKTDRQ
jgi:hypothetical protein